MENLENMNSEAFEEEETLEEVAYEPVAKVGGYRALAVIVFLLSVGGLFLGLLGKWVSLLGHVMYRAGGFLSGSLLGYVIAYARALFSGGFKTLFQGPWSAKISNVVLLALIVLLCVAVISSIVCLIVALCSRKAARRSAMTSAILSFLAYTLLFLLWYATMAFISAKLNRMMFDLPVAIIAGALFLCLAITAIARRKGVGVLNVLLYLFTLGVLFALVYPASYSAIALLISLSAGEMFIRIAVLTIAGLLLFNLIVGAIRMSAERGYLFDCIRYILLLVAVLVFVIATIVSEEEKWILFKSGNLLASITLMVAAVAALLLALITYIIMRVHSIKKAEVEANSVEEDEEEDVVFEAPAAPAAEAGEPVAENGEFSQFEMEMRRLASGFTPAPAPAAEEPAAAQQSAVTPMYEPNTQYTYDPFINTLTPQEKNEFGDLFIAHKNGSYGDLPVYHIGSDNTEFFRKVWIRYSVYDMSPELKEKLYQYIRFMSKN